MKTKNTRAFTLIELLTVIAIIGILAAIIIPVVGKVRQSARRASCLSNIRQIGTAIFLYADDNKGYGPKVSGRKMTLVQEGGAYLQFGLLLPYLGVNAPANPANLKKTPDILICPDTDPSRRDLIANRDAGVLCTYWMNPDDINASTRLDALAAETPMRAVVSDFCAWWTPTPWTSGTEPLPNHAGSGLHVFRLNGSASWLPVAKTSAVITPGNSYKWDKLDEISSR
ncbi:N-terminal cleavage protein [Opitutaceae bacterium TAV5]|nr:N-terminal cleavage protein [Opitutaceae bacterium TAV5]